MTIDERLLAIQDARRDHREAEGLRDLADLAESDLIRDEHRADAKLAAERARDAWERIEAGAYDEASGLLSQTEAAGVRAFGPQWRPRVDQALRGLLARSQQGRNHRP